MQAAAGTQLIEALDEFSKIDFAMIRLTIALTRQKQLSASEFHDYWLNEHAPLVRELAETLGIKRYVQSHAVAPKDLKRGLHGDALYDGLAHVWYLSYADFLKHIKTVSGKEAAIRLREDEERFAQTSLSRTWWSEDHTII